MSCHADAYTLDMVTKRPFPRADPKSSQPIYKSDALDILHVCEHLSLACNYIGRKYLWICTNIGEIHSPTYYQFFIYFPSASLFAL